MLEAVYADLVSPSAWSAAPQIFCYPQLRRPITPSMGSFGDMCTKALALHGPPRSISGR